MHARAGCICVYSVVLKGATRSDVISNAYVLPGARLARPSQFACAQRQRLQDASAEHAYISGLSSSLRGRRKKTALAKMVSPEVCAKFIFLRPR